jgi:hypothetical protein
VRWSLSELEDIVYEFINAHSLPNEFNIPITGTQKAKNEKQQKVTFSKDVK